VRQKDSLPTKAILSNQDYWNLDYWFCQIFVTISKVLPNIREKSRQKFVKISVTLCSTLLSFCQIFMTIIIAYCHKLLAQCHKYLAGPMRREWDRM